MPELTELELLRDMFFAFIAAIGASVFLFWLIDDVIWHGLIRPVLKAQAKEIRESARTTSHEPRQGPPC